MHQIERVIDLRQRELVRDQIVDVDLVVHIPIDDPRNIGPPPRPAESSSLPDPTRHQLERPRLDLLPRAGDADDDGNAPTAVTTFERLSHYIDIADAFEAVVGAAISQ